MLISIIYACLMFIVVMIGIRYRDIKKNKKLYQKISTMVVISKNNVIYLIISFLGIVGGMLILELVYTQNSVIQNIRCITVISLLFVAAFYDYLEYRIPNKIIFLGLILWVGITFTEVIAYKDIWLKNFISEIIVCIAFSIICILCLIIVKNGLGMGDVKILLLIGLLQGLDGAMSSIFTSIIVIFFACVFFLLTKKKQKNDVIPFAPYILIGTFISICVSGY